MAQMGKAVHKTTVAQTLKKARMLSQIPLDMLETVGKWSLV